MEDRKNPTIGEASSPPKNNFQVRKLTAPRVLVPGAIVLAVLVFLGLDYLFSVLTHEKTDDAFVAGHIVSVAPRIPGQVAAVHVQDNQMVHSNDLLVEIDPSDYAVALSQRQAAQAAQESNYKAAMAGFDLMGVKVKTAGADARSSKADADAAAATANKAKADFERAKALQKDNTISSQEFDQAKAAAELAIANQNSAEQKAESDASKVDEAKAQLAAAEAEAGSVLAQVNQSKTAVDQAQLNLSYTKIMASCDGRVTRKQVEAGDYLQAGQTLFSIVPADIWVVANFKESQLKKMKPGQRATVKIDALGGKKFRAHVESLQAGSGAAFSLLPPENATGNFVKVVQRVPVKIVFDEPLPSDKAIGPGLSVEPSVLVASFDVPSWATAILAVILAIVVAIVFNLVIQRQSSR
jgi:membrane fusion protein, multidrug efflux system